MKDRPKQANIREATWRKQRLYRKQKTLISLKE